MKLTREQVRSMLMAGTVAVPPSFPELGLLTLYCFAADTCDNHKLTNDHVLKVEQRTSPKLLLTRTFRVSDVAIVFLPDNPASVDLRKGRWLMGDEIVDELSNHAQAVAGIAYVREQAGSLLQVEIGMTAAESVEYYPPLPDDRSVNHYRFQSPGLVRATGSGRRPRDCDDYGRAPRDCDDYGRAPRDCDDYGRAPRDCDDYGRAPRDCDDESGGGIVPLDCD